MKLSKRYQKVEHYQPSANDPLRDEHEQLELYEREVRGKANDSYYSVSQLKDLETGQQILKCPADVHCRLVIAALQRLEHTQKIYIEISKNGISSQHPLDITRSALYFFIYTILRRKLPFDRGQILILLDTLSEHLQQSEYYTYNFPYSGISKAIVDYYSAHENHPSFDNAIQSIIDFGINHDNCEIRKHTLKILAASGKGPTLLIRSGEHWADAAISWIKQQNESAAQKWETLVDHCANHSGGKPNKKWATAATTLVEEIGKDSFCTAVKQWFVLVDKPRTQVIDSWSEWSPNPNLMINTENADVLKGLVWCSGLIGEPATAAALGKLALTAYKKVPGIGPRASKVGNACVWALGQIDSDAALAELAILKVRVKFKPAQKGIANSLAVAAERAGLTPEELEEIGVPDYGMQEVGERKELFGDCTAILSVASSTKTALSWISSTGKAVKSVPKVVRDNHADQLKELRADAKNITKMLSAQRERMDNLFLSKRSWNYADWLDRYIHHPLNGTLGRRLIWVFEKDGGSQSGIWWQDRIVNSSGGTITPAAGTQITIWHPATDDTDTVLAWREWLESHQITQPFKQAHREIYLLTDAEINTGVYSNRYASHVVKQHQFNALCAQRRWNHALRMMVDDEYAPPSVDLPEWDLRAEFWVEGLGEDYGTDTTESGSYLYLATDQLRFYRREAAQNSAHAGGGGYSMMGTETDINTPISLSDIDPLVLSEVMRDIDLFVGVSSVGNDPNWADGGPEGRFFDYWNSYSFGELGESAKTRKQLLERLVPRLKIKDRCSFEERFLIVRGDVRTYKIHLGSGNILMEPNGQYLCIVAAQGRAKQADSVFLPFEGDGRLALILSKAFLLAEDTKITDTTILSQIKH